IGTVSSTAQGNYGIRPGDSLQIEVLEDSNLNRSVLVTPDGRISFPLAGTVNVRGRTVEQVRRAITSRIADNFANEPTVFVAVSRVAPDEPIEEPILEEPEMITVYLVGEVSAPGPKEVEPGITVLQFLSTTGGFTRFAATKRLQLRRHTSTGERLITVNYHALSRGARQNRHVHLHDGDVILVPERRLFE
ncbi:MAG: polysaccharide biosynthesis/export family protein, partial [Pseudomonadota bacterium]